MGHATICRGHERQSAFRYRLGQIDQPRRLVAGIAFPSKACTNAQSLPPLDACHQLHAQIKPGPDMKR